MNSIIKKFGIITINFIDLNKDGKHFESVFQETIFNTFGLVADSFKKSDSERIIIDFPSQNHYSPLSDIQFCNLIQYLDENVIKFNIEIQYIWRVMQKDWAV